MSKVEVFNINSFKEGSIIQQFLDHNSFNFWFLILPPIVFHGCDLLWWKVIVVTFGWFCFRKFVISSIPRKLWRLKKWLERCIVIIGFCAKLKGFCSGSASLINSLIQTLCVWNEDVLGSLFKRDIMAGLGTNWIYISKLVILDPHLLVLYQDQFFLKVFFISFIHIGKLQGHRPSLECLHLVN